MGLHLKHVWPGVLLAAAAAATDRLTKVMAVRQLQGQAVKSLIPGVLELCYVENTGMAFGLLKDARVFFAVITVILLAGILWVYFKLPAEKRYRPVFISLSLITGGTVGNFIDRISRGYVVDFLNLSLIDFPVFNLADIYITWPAVLLAVLGIFYYKEEDFKKLGL